MINGGCSSSLLDEFGIDPGSTFNDVAKLDRPKTREVRKGIDHVRTLPFAVFGISGGVGLPHLSA